MRSLIITVDYEVFGNGTGDVRQHVVNPTWRMAEACQSAGVPLTVFFEAEEYLAFERHTAVLEQRFGYNAAQLMREQVRSLAQQGHDVQLHLHPEWYDARWQQGRWLLTSKRTVDELFGSQTEVTRYIAERKALIEELTSRKVWAYRAGAFSAQPGHRLLTALAETGMLIDSSVVKGLTRVRPAEASAQAPSGSSPVFDYRNAPCAKGPWRIKDDVARFNPAGPLWEFPIYSVMGRRFQQLNFQRLRAKFSRHVPKERQQQMVSQLGLRTRSPWQLLQFLFQSVPLKLDFHNVAAAKLLRWIKAAPMPLPGHPDVLVLIGHSKEHVEDRNFEAFLGRVRSDPTLEVISFTQLAERLAAAALKLEPTPISAGALQLTGAVV